MDCFKIDNFNLTRKIAELSKEKIVNICRFCIVLMLTPLNLTEFLSKKKPFWIAEFFVWKKSREIGVFPCIFHRKKLVKPEVQSVDNFDFTEKFRKIYWKKLFKLNGFALLISLTTSISRKKKKKMAMENDFSMTNFSL